MKELINEIQDWFASNHPEMTDTFKNGASEQELYTLEQITGLILPEDFKEFYRHHNGQKETHLTMFGGDLLLSIDRIIMEWNNWKKVLPEILRYTFEEYGKKITSDPDRGIKNDWWNHFWLPITSNGCGGNYCIDLDPTEEGKSGQIIRMLHDNASRKLVAPSFSEWLKNYLSDLKKGKYEFSDSEGWGGMVIKYD